MAMESGKTRVIQYDLLRIVAAFSVVMLHSAAQFWYTLPVTQTEWKIANCYDASFRFGVPIFVMISGALFLGREVNIKRLYTHNILRLIIVYLLWSVVYGFFDCTRFNLADLSLSDYMKEFLTGRYHLWFLPMIIGIYMILPILQSWLKNAEKKNIQYLLVLFLVFRIGRDTISALQFGDTAAYLLNIFSASELAVACSYIGYFVLGYYIVSFGIPKKWHKFIYAGVIPSIILNIVLDTYMAMKANAPVGIIYDSFGVFTFNIVVALFLFFTEVLSKVNYSAFAKKLIQEVSQATFGIYLAHVLCIEALERCGIHSMIIPNIVGIPLLAVGAFVLCYIFAALLRRIPFVGKYIC